MVGWARRRSELAGAARRGGSGGPGELWRGCRSGPRHGRRVRSVIPFPTWQTTKKRWKKKTLALSVNPKSGSTGSEIGEANRRSELSSSENVVSNWAM